MKKIGIATQYTNSCNYGGVLQAFALCDKLNKEGYHADQICYMDRGVSFKKKIKGSAKKGYLIRIIKNRIKALFNKLIGRLNNSQIHISQFKAAFVEFRTNIPHTELTYNCDTITSCNDFDIYVTGSDQVWRIGRFHEISKFYWLSFADNNKTKISYAASISTKDIPHELYPNIKEILSSYKAISVREQQDKKIVDRIMGRDIARWVLDPTLLLSRKEWEEQCADNPFIGKHYVFAYILGDNKCQRKLVTDWAKKSNKIVINIPYLLGQYRSCDRKFGDIRKSDVTPNLWLSLIRDADCVFTDSFHATVFSSIFHTPFYVFKRNKDTEKTSMNSRIYSLTELLGCENRIIENDADINSIPALDDIDFIQADKNVAIKKEESISFLKDALEG